jgi:hypothetical protein
MASKSVSARGTLALPLPTTSVLTVFSTSPETPQFVVWFSYIKSFEDELSIRAFLLNLNFVYLTTCFQEFALYPARNVSSFIRGEAAGA